MKSIEFVSLWILLIATENAKITYNSRFMIRLKIRVYDTCGNHNRCPDSEASKETYDNDRSDYVRE